MWKRIKKLFCRCKDRETISEYSILQVCKCTKCSKYWLYNKIEKSKVKLTQTETVDLVAEWAKLRG